MNIRILHSWFYQIKTPELTIEGVLQKKVILKISHSLHENNYARVSSLINLHACGKQFY